MDDDFWEILFILFANWWTILIVFTILLVLSLTGVIPWGDWV